MARRLTTTTLSVGMVTILVAAPVLAEVITSEFSSDPLAEGWTVVGQWGEVTTWVEDGVYYQDFPNNCEPGPVCGNESLSRSIAIFNNRPNWFYEYRVSATGDHTEIQNGAPTVLSAFNSYGNLYHATLASDRIKLSGDMGLPILFLDVEPGVPHTIRLELFNDPPPATFHWYVDSVLVLEGPADSPFPDFNSRIVWQGRTWRQPTLNAWYYIRGGDIPVDASGDFDSDGSVDLFDFYYFQECMLGPDIDAGPGCRFADMNQDGAVDMSDFLAFQATLDAPQ